MAETTAAPLIQIQDLRVQFFLDEGTVKAVDGVSFDVPRGRTLGVVGESGCGKSVTAQAILRIVPRPGTITDGQILFHREKGQEPVDLARLNPHGDRIRSIRGKEIAMIFQEPMTSFSPVHTVGNQIMEAILLHQDVSRAEARKLAADMLDRVGIPKAEQRVDEYPYQLSGGMRQRAMIAMALSCNPALIIADEPTTALDVTIQAQILRLMQDIQKEFDMGIMLITHNLGVIAAMAERVVIMYLGKVVEEASVEEMFYNPLHPYTRALLRSIPRVGRKVRQRLEAIKGMVPNPYAIPAGCTFHTRCPEFRPDACDRIEPNMLEVQEGHRVSCLLYESERS